MYCKYNIPCDVTKALTSLLLQLIHHNHKLNDESLKVLKECKEKQRSLLVQEILAIFQTEAKDLTLLVNAVDGLDECFPEDARHTLLGHLQRITEVNLFMRLFVTSRPHPVIENAITGVTRFPLTALPRDLEFHIRNRLASNMTSLRKFLQEDAQLQDEIVTKILQKANGMYVPHLLAYSTG